jgi:hypothetical protein
LLWTATVLLAIPFLISGLPKLFQPRDVVARRMRIMADFPPAGVKALGAVEVLGVLGLFLPALTRIAPILVPVAATGFAVLMVLASIAHARRGEYRRIGLNVVLFALAVFVAWERFGPYAL